MNEFLIHNEESGEFQRKKFATVEDAIAYADTLCKLKLGSTYAVYELARVRTSVLDVVDVCDTTESNDEHI